MERREIGYLKSRVSCEGVLGTAGFAIDIKESTRRAVKHRRGSDIIIVIHGGGGWFDPLSDAKGDVLSLIQHLEHVPFAGALDRARELVGFVPATSRFPQVSRGQGPLASLAGRWRVRREPRPGSATWRYLHEERFLSEVILCSAMRQDRLREGPCGSMWAAHVDDDGGITGWEERGREWRRFSTGGTKALFRLGAADARRLLVTEAAIDAMSLAALEGLREGSLYLSTGGGWSPATEAALRRLAARPGALMIAATDANAQGEIFADRLRAIAVTTGCDWFRLAPPAEDWNDALGAKMREKQMQEKEMKEKKQGNGPAACPPAASRVKLRPG